MANTTSVAPINTEGNELTLQGYTQGIADDAAAWLSTELANGTFRVPEGYDIKGECSSAALKLMNAKSTKGDPILSVCSRESVLMFFKDMVAQNLSFVNNQCYAIPYGDVLTCTPSYFGERAIFSENYPGLIMTANVIYDGDSYDYCTDAKHGYNYIDNHKSSLQSRNKQIVAAYCTVLERESDKRVNGCVMTWEEIQTSWSQSRNKSVQEKFPVDMAKRTVFKKMCKEYNNLGKGNFTPMQLQAYRRNEEAEYIDATVSEETASRHVPETKAKGSAGFDKMAARAEEAKTEEIPF